MWPNMPQVNDINHTATMTEHLPETEENTASPVTGGSASHDTANCDTSSCDPASRGPGLGAPNAPDGPRFGSPAIFIGLAILLAVVCLLVYSTALDGVFLFDDLPNILENRAVIDGQLLSGSRPVTHATFVGNYAWSGFDAKGFHWVNNLIHALAAVALLWWACLTFAHPKMAKVAAIRQPALAAFAAALLWSVHPLNTQAVTYIVQRAESLMGLCFFLYMVGLTKSSLSARRIPWLLFTIVALVCGLAAKQVMVMAVPVGLLYDRVFLADSWKQLARERGWYWGAIVGVGLIAVAVNLPSILSGSGGVGLQLASVTPLEYATSQPGVLLHYLRLAVWPVPQNLDYGWGPETRWLWIVVPSTLLLLGLGAAAINIFRGGTWGFWPSAAFCVLLPTSSFLPLQDLAVEHRMYVPLAMLVVLFVHVLVWVSSKVSDGPSWLIPAAVCSALAIGGAWLTAKRNADYGSAIRMWEDVVAKQEASPRPLMLRSRALSNLGEAYGDAEQWEKSIDALNRALNAGKFPAKVHANLARAYIANQNLSKAAEHASQAIAMEPKDARVRQQAGLIAAQAGNMELAEQYFREAADLDPADVVVQTNLGRCLLMRAATVGNSQDATSIEQKKDSLADAAKLFSKAIASDPSQELAYEGLIGVSVEQGDFEKAEQLAMELLQRFPETPERWELLGNIHSAKGDLLNAVRWWEKAAIADKPPRMVNFRLGNYHRSEGKLSIAAKYYEREVNVDPSNIDALNNLAGSLAQSNPQMAIRYFERVLVMAPEYLQAEFNIAALYANLGDKTQARSRLEAILAKQPDFSPAKQLLESLQ